MALRILNARITLVLACAIIPVAARADGEPARIAASARFDLTGDAHVRSLENGRVRAGSGTISRMNWVPESDQSRGYTVSLPVSHIGWRPLSIEFTPARAGIVTLTLMGPWEEASRGVLYREEVLWDDIK